MYFHAVADKLIQFASVEKQKANQVQAFMDLFPVVVENYHNSETKTSD